MKKIAWINRWIVLSPYCIGLCVSEELFKKELKRLKLPIKDWPEFVPKHKDARVHLFQNGSYLCAILCIKKNKKVTKSEIIGLIVHEAVHIWQEIKLSINESNPSIEFEAEAMQNISQRLIEAYYGERSL
jgi:hypothetical protein